ncbi:aminoacyl-histidine dipeptidase [Maribacter sp. 2307ULW6-5]|uniref:aminoacyl-histidine dipeptidase n=1 Tax=Maribacter sp. 2307ULW6-5 TaxID=3386275 RepID=UPI0039BCF3CE
MSNSVTSLAPKAIWKNFAALNAVPRPSKKEERVIAFMMQFGNALGLETLKDDIGNIVIRKPATRGMEDRKMVTLQSHLDMVHQKNADTVFDFDAQGIAMEVAGDWVRAKGTTLGADNGLGVATIMALLESSDVPHPPLEALFTIDEETGMTGAFGLAPNWLKGDILLNLDTEEDDEIDIGCAGGVDVTAKRTYNQKEASHGDVGCRIEVSGLQGGHSGMDIHKGLGNANKIMNRLLFAGLSHNMRISRLEGGSLRNAIPRESVCELNVHRKDEAAFREGLESMAKVVQIELAQREPNLRISLKPIKPAKKVMGLGAQGKLIRALYGAHNGVYAMSASMPNLVETSNNLARVQVKNGKIKISCLTRSSQETGKMDLANGLRSVFELAGCEVEFSGSYPGWQPNPDSQIVKLATKVYQDLFKEMPRVVACHAGLECGILGQHYPDMDMVSFGPTILGAHSPDERVGIASVQKFWNFLRAILLEVPKR